MRLRVFLLLLVFSDFHAIGDDLDAINHSCLSPNGHFEVYRLPEGTGKDANDSLYDYGTKLFLRLCGSKKIGILLRENSRWMAALWSPDSRYLGIEDHWDGHGSNVYVYEVGLSEDRRSVTTKMVFQSPEQNAYDLKWFIEGWDPSSHMIHLCREQRANDGMEVPKSWAHHRAIEHLSFVIGD
jgi:hypothetical protein